MSYYISVRCDCCGKPNYILPRYKVGRVSNLRQHLREKEGWITLKYGTTNLDYCSVECKNSEYKILSFDITFDEHLEFAKWLKNDLTNKEFQKRSIEEHLISWYIEYKGFEKSKDDSIKKNESNDITQQV